MPHPSAEARLAIAMAGGLQKSDLKRHQTLSHATAGAMADGTAVLILIQGRDPGSRFKLPENRVTTIGRSSQNRISLVNPTVSRFHCEIAFSNGDWYLTDLNSKAGTRLNGKPVGQRKHLESGDVIRIGSAVLKFELTQESARDDDSLLAIQGAVLDAEVKSKGEAVASFEDMRQRSQFAVDGDRVREAPDELPPPDSRDMVINTLFVVGTALVVGLITFGVIYPRYLAVQERWRVHRDNLEKAQKAYQRAIAKAQGPQASIPEALASLKQVAAEYATTPQAGEAREKMQELRREYAERELARIAEMEADGRYGDALAAYDELLKMLKDPAMIALTDQRREHTLRLAEAALEDVEKQAARAMLRRREAEAAIEVYEKASQRIGVPSVQEKIDRRIERLESTGSG